MTNFTIVINAKSPDLVQNDFGCQFQSFAKHKHEKITVCWQMEWGGLVDVELDPFKLIRLMDVEIQN